MKRAFSALVGRDDEAVQREQAYRVLLEKRCDVYTRVAGLLMDVEDAFEREDVERARYSFDEIRRTLRAATAFLSEEVYRALVEAEVVFGGPQKKGEEDRDLAPGVEEDIRDALAVLHVKLGRLLELPGPDVVSILGLAPRLQKKLEDDRAAAEERARKREVEARLETDERIARDLIAEKQYKKALRHLKRAVKLDPERAVLQNDLGVVYGLLGCHEQAVECYRSAASLNERFPDRRTEEWTTSYRNLGIALQRLASEEEDGGDPTRALLHAKEAKKAFESYLEVTPDGPSLAEARSLARRTDDEIRFLEERVRADAEAGDAPAQTSWLAGAE